MSKTISEITDIPAVAQYLARVGAEPRSLLKAVVKEKQGAYWVDKAEIEFSKTGKVKTTAAYEPTDAEMVKIEAAFAEAEFPSQVTLKALVNLPDDIKNAPDENIYEFKNRYGEYVMLQVRVDLPDDDPRGKVYVPYTYWSDGRWRRAEPEGKLPLYGADKIEGNVTVFIHEGAKAARAMQRLAEAADYDSKRDLADHPWSEYIRSGVHVGWIGGALSPGRTDWSVLKELGINRAYIVSDNDAPGLKSVPTIAKHLRMETFHVQFTDEWPMSFDMADKWPESMFKNIDGKRYYVGPAFKSCVHPATWATDRFKGENDKMITVLRDHFKSMWAYIEESDLWVCREMPEIIRTEPVANKMMSAFSHSSKTTELLLREYQGRQTKICYRPDVDGRIVTDRSTSAINLHIPTNFRPEEGDPAPWIEFLEYMFPVEEERKEVERWCATLIAKPSVRMEYGMLLVSEAQGIGKTTLGSAVLAKLVGDHNVGYPTEKTITDGTFTDWIAQKRLIIVNEIYSGHSWKAYNTLKTYITDKDINVNAKYRQPYTIENWAHIIACSNSMRALRMEEDDRRWYYPEVAEVRWPADKFRAFHRWLNSGGLGIILSWAIKYGDYVRAGDRAPMTERKKEMIAGSRSEAQTEAAALAEAASMRSEPIAFSMKGVVNWVRTSSQGRVYDSDYDLRKTMKEAGMSASKIRVYIDGRSQYAMLNSAAVALVAGKGKKEAGDVIRGFLKKPGDVFESDM